MTRYRRRALLFALGATLLVAGCSAQAGDSPSAAAAVSASPSQATTAGPTSDADSRPLQDLLPADFRGTPAHTFAVGEEMLAALASDVRARRADVEVAFASDHGPAFVQMFAIRIAGHEAAELLAALPAAAYPDAEPSTVSAAPAELGGREVTVISQPDEASRLGTFYALVDGGTLIVAQALAEPVAEAALQALPKSEPGRYR